MKWRQPLRENEYDLGEKVPREMKSRLCGCHFHFEQTTIILDRNKWFEKSMLLLYTNT